jgi:hypothetical protein
MMSKIDSRHSVTPCMASTGSIERFVETIVVDGSDQPGLGGTTLSVKAEAPDTWIVARKAGSRLMLNATPAPRR